MAVPEVSRPVHTAGENMVCVYPGLNYAEKACLKHLSLRYNPRYGGGWPSNQEIADSCSLSLTTVKLALRRLEHKFGLIVRVSRGMGRSKLKDILWAKLITNYALVLAAKAAARAEDSTGVAYPSDANESSAEDQAVLDSFDGPIPLPPSEPYSRLEEVSSLIRETFTGHVTLGAKDADRMLADCIRSCIDVAGSSDLCFDVVQWVCTHVDEEKTRTSIQKSGKLAGYIKSCFRGWLDRYPRPKPNFNEYLAIACIDRAPFAASAAKIEELNEFCTWLKDIAGHHLLDLSYEEVEGKTSATFKFTEAFRAALILGVHSGQPTSPEFYEASGIPAVDELCDWAVYDDRWSDRLRDAPEVNQFFLAHQDQILSDRSRDTNSENNARTEEETHV
jgi:hypothetical protein